MEKRHFYLRLIGPRPTFAQDMTDEERTLMVEHGRYTAEHFNAGKILIYGPVLASDGAFGMAVFEVADEAEARAILENDPTVKIGMNRYEISPMLVAQARGL